MAHVRLSPSRVSPFFLYFCPLSLKAAFISFHLLFSYFNIWTLFSFGSLRATFVFPGTIAPTLFSFHFLSFFISFLFFLSCTVLDAESL
ncbi:MAG: hypothetical protein BYD32DRAFT_90556 [Podila humilis]|nr:MAG: hypothetical protein BYD32DRAFT_90556 [Podila humilis]